MFYNVMYQKSRLNSEMIWKIQKKRKLNSEKKWKLWKKAKLNCEKIWKIWKKGRLKWEKGMENTEEKQVEQLYIVKRYGQYGRKAS